MTKRYVVMSPEGPTPYETDYLQEAVAHIVMRPALFVWDRQEEKVVAR